MSDTPVTSIAPINMVVASGPDAPTIHACSKMLISTETTPTADVKSASHSHCTLTTHRGPQGHSLTNAEDRSLLQNEFHNGYSMAKHLSMKLILSLILKDFSITYYGFK